MKNITKPSSLFTTVLVSLLFLITPIPSFAIGQITQPIEIKNAQRGTSYEENVTVINTDKNIVFVIPSGEGDIGKWVSFHEKENSSENINLIEMQPGETKTFVARFTIPETTPNGTYGGFVSVRTNPDQGQSKENESSATISQKIDREVTIEVGGEESVNFDISFISDKFDYQKGDVMRIRTIYNNLGNVEISPQISFKIRQDNSTLYSAIFPFPENQEPIMPGSMMEISSLEIPLTNFSSGKYEAVFEITEKDVVVQKNFTFSVGMVKFESASNIEKELPIYDIAYFSGLGILALSILFFGIRRNKRKKKVLR